MLERCMRTKLRTKLRKYCKAKWNGSGDDVFQQAVMIALERYNSLDNINFSLFRKLCQEAARNLKLYETQPGEDGWMIITPQKEKTRERLSEHFSTADADDPLSKYLDEKEKKQWLEKIKEMKTKGWSDEEIIKTLSPFAAKKKEQEQQQQQEQLHI